MKYCARPISRSALFATCQVEILRKFLAQAPFRIKLCERRRNTATQHKRPTNFFLLFAPTESKTLLWYALASRVAIKFEIAIYKRRQSRKFAFCGAKNRIFCDFPYLVENADKIRNWVACSSACMRARAMRCDHARVKIKTCGAERLLLSLVASVPLSSPSFTLEQQHRCSPAAFSPLSSSPPVAAPASRCAMHPCGARWRRVPRIPSYVFVFLW